MLYTAGIGASGGDALPGGNVVLQPSYAAEDRVLERFVAFIGEKSAQIEERTARVRFAIFPPFEIVWGEEFARLAAPKGPLDVKDFYNLADAVDYARDRWGIDPSLWHRESQRPEAVAEGRP